MLALISDVLIALAYISIPIQLSTFMVSSGLLKAYFSRSEKMNQEDEAEQGRAKMMVVAVGALFTSFILLCGLTHLFAALMEVKSHKFETALLASKVACAIVSLATAGVLFVIFPYVLSLLKLLEVTRRGKLQEMSRLMHLVTDHCTEVIATHSVDLHLRFLSINGASSVCFRRAADTLIGQPFYAVVNDEDCQFVRATLEGMMQRALQASVVESTSTTVEYRVKLMEDEPVLWVESSVSIAYEDLRPLVIIITRNITWRKQMEEQRRQNEKEERDTSVTNAKLHYITCTAHDLKTPLASFRIAVDLLNRTRLDGEQKALANQASVCVELMKLTIAQAMDLGKVTSGKMLEPRRSTVYLDELLQQCHLVIQAFARQVPIHSSIDPEVWRAVITDGEWVWQMIMNYLTNACKFTEKGLITINITLSDNRTKLLISVTDTGIGVLPEMRDKLFSPFSEIQHNQRDGTGLGLWSVKLHCERLGGACGMSPNLRPGGGSIFWFNVPYRPDMSTNPCERKDSEVPLSPLAPYVALPNTSEASSPGLQAWDELPGGSHLSPRLMQKSVLVVDDVRSIRKLLAKALERLNFGVIDECENGKQALDRMQQQEFDLIICDYQMPFMTGPEAVKRFRTWEQANRQNRQIIIAMSANAEPEDVAAGLAAGFDGFLAKPLEFQNVKDIVDKYCPSPHPA